MSAVVTNKTAKHNEEESKEAATNSADATSAPTTRNGRGGRGGKGGNGRGGSNNSTAVRQARDAPGTKDVTLEPGYRLNEPCCRPNHKNHTNGECRGSMQYRKDLPCYICHKRDKYDGHDNEGCKFQTKYYSTQNDPKPADSSLKSQAMVPTTQTPDGAGASPAPAAVQNLQSSRPSVDGLNAAGNGGRGRGGRGRGGGRGGNSSAGSSSTCLISDKESDLSKQEDGDFLAAVSLYEDLNGPLPAALLANPAAITSDGVPPLQQRAVKPRCYI
jgi:hypothetical protein